MRRYSFLDTVLLVNSVPITGWADGDDVISIMRRINSAEDQVGLDGNMMISISSDRSGEVSFKLQQTSSSNAFLLNLLHLQEAMNSTFEPISVLFQDTYRQDSASGALGYIRKPIDIVRGAKANTVEWVLIIERLDFLLGDINNTLQ